MSIFDFSAVAQEAGITPEQLQTLCDSVRREFPKDDMMYELHVLRACMAIRDGRITLEDTLRPAPAAKP